MTAPKNHSGSGLGSSCLRKTKEPVTRQSLSVDTWLCRLFTVPFTGKSPWANPISQRRDQSRVLNITSRDRVTARLNRSDLPHRLIRHCTANWTNIVELGDGQQRGMLAEPNPTHPPEAWVDGSKIKCWSDGLQRHPIDRSSALRPFPLVRPAIVHLQTGLALYDTWRRNPIFVCFKNTVCLV